MAVKANVCEGSRSRTPDLEHVAFEEWRKLNKNLRDARRIEALQCRCRAVQRGVGNMKWSFEPGHTAAEFRARHMMVTWVRGSFKNVTGQLEFDPANPRRLAVETVIDASTCWTGVQARDDHLRSADFLHCEQFPGNSLQEHRRG